MFHDVDTKIRLKDLSIPPENTGNGAKTTRGRTGPQLPQIVLNPLFVAVSHFVILLELLKRRPVLS